VEIMSEFKVGIKVKVIRLNTLLNLKIKIDDVRSITDTCPTGVQLDGLSDGWINDEDVKLVVPKWSIYNNDLPWKKLSNKQKGKMLLAAHEKVPFCGCGNELPIFNLDSQVYVAIKPEPVKPTMAELFVSDWTEQDSFYKINVANHMITKGWTKPCK
jgi:hypothetical protein